MASLTSHCRVNEVSLVVTSVRVIRYPPPPYYAVFFSLSNGKYCTLCPLQYSGTLFLYLFIFSDISPSAPSDHLSLVIVLTHSALLRLYRAQYNFSFSYRSPPTLQSCTALIMAKPSTEAFKAFGDGLASQILSFPPLTLKVAESLYLAFLCKLNYNHPDDSLLLSCSLIFHQALF